MRPAKVVGAAHQPHACFQPAAASNCMPIASCQACQALSKGRERVQPMMFPYTPGIEVAGVVEDVGPTVTAFEIGQAVFGQIAEGAYAEYLTVPIEALVLKPKTLSFVEAATMPVGATTAWRTLFDPGGLVSGPRLLIQGTAGGGGQCY